MILTDKIICCLERHLTSQYPCERCKCGANGLYDDNGCNTYRSVMGWWNEQKKKRKIVE